MAHAKANAKMNHLLLASKAYVTSMAMTASKPKAVSRLMRMSHYRENQNIKAREPRASVAEDSWFGQFSAAVSAHILSLGWRNPCFVDPILAIASSCRYAFRKSLICYATKANVLPRRGSGGLCCDCCVRVVYKLFRLFPLLLYRFYSTIKVGLFA